MDESPQVDSRIFERAMEIPEGERAAFAAAVCPSPEDAARLLSLLGKIDKLGSFLEPAGRTRERAPFLAPGTVLASRFRIVHLAGTGGMGEVYCAEDELPGVRVALKICRGEEWARGELLERLKEEVRLGLRISNPNVCRIQTIFSGETAGDIPLFFTMEWLEGTTLAEEISRRGKTPPDECLAVISGVAEGLTAIHAEGIVHRDLKPGNIFLLPDLKNLRRVVITDLGLAREARPAGSATGPGPLAGTPDYMAPEQFLGEECTSATDVYALGLICFELLTGAKPNAGANFLETAIRRSMGRKAIAGIANAEIPVGWRGAIERALDADPSRRYATPRDFVAALSPGGTDTRMPSRRRVMLLGISASTVALLATILRFKGKGRIRQGKQVLMRTETTAAPGDSELELAAGISSRLLRQQFAQSAHISVIPGNRTAAIWQRIRTAKDPAALPAVLDAATARNIALRAGGTLALFSSLSNNGGENILQVRLERLSGSTATSADANRKDFHYAVASDLPKTVDEAAKWVRAEAGEPVVELNERNRHSDELTTPSWQALREYVRGDSEWTAGHPGPAMLHLKAALEIDREFAAAAIRLADILMANGQPDDSYRQYASAVGVLTTRNLTDRESLKARGLFALDVGLNGEALDAFQRYALEYPDDPLGRFYQGAALDGVGRPEEAQVQFSAAMALAPENYAISLGRCRHLLEVGDLNGARRDLETASRLATGDWTDQHRMCLEFAGNNPEGAAQAIRNLRTKGSLEFKSKSYALEACLQGELGNMDSAEGVLREGLRFDAANPVPVEYPSVKRRLLIQILIALNRGRDAREVCRELLRQRPGRVFQMQLAGLLAETGDFEEARKLLADTSNSEWPVYGYWRRRLEFELALWAKDAGKIGTIVANTPDPPYRHVFPAHLIRAARAAPGSGAAEGLGQAVKAGAGRWWLEPEWNPPGFFRRARMVVREFGIQA